jgi:type III pantothenate kinase
MDWLFDLGNSRLKWACAADGQAGQARAFAHPGADGQPAGALSAALADALAAALAAGPAPARAVIASVGGPARTAALEARLDALGIARVRVASEAGVGGLALAYAEPATLGVDRFLALLAAHRRGPGPWLVASVGTALTCDLLHAGRHLGGWIAPSPTLMREALVARVPALDVPGGEAVAFAADTAGALASGARAAACGALEHAAAEAADALGAAPTLLLAGGGAEALQAGLRLPARLAPSLVLEGLAAWAALSR